MQYRTRSGLLCLALALAGAAFLAGCGDAPKPLQQGVPTVGVMTVKVQKVPLLTRLAGRTTAHLASDVRPQVGGIIVKRLFTEGSFVKKDAVLYEIDPALYKAAYDSAKAALLRAEANLVSARLLAERYSEVVKVNAVSKQQRDDAVAAYGQARAEVAAAKASVETARINLDYTKVKAPVAGHIGKSAVTPGALVTANQAGALARVQQLDPMYVDVTQSSVDILRLRRALAQGKLASSGKDEVKVKLLLEDGSVYEHLGVLHFFDVTVDQSTGMITVRAEFPNKDNLLFPGMFVRAVLEEAVNENAVLAPQQGVSYDTQGRPFALVVKNGVVELRLLTVDRSVDLQTVSPELTGTAWLVSSGLAEGDQLILEGLQNVAPGRPAKTREVAPAGTQKQGAANATAAGSPGR